MIKEFISNHFISIYYASCKDNIPHCNNDAAAELMFFILSIALGSSKPNFLAFYFICSIFF